MDNSERKQDLYGKYCYQILYQDPCIVETGQERRMISFLALLQTLKTSFCMERPHESRTKSLSEQILFGSHPSSCFNLDRLDWPTYETK